MCYYLQKYTKVYKIMSFKEWITSSYPNPGIDGRWGWLHKQFLFYALPLLLPWH